MEQNTTNAPALATRPRDILTEILRNGAQRMLAAAVEDEVAAYIEVHRDQCDAVWSQNSAVPEYRQESPRRHRSNR